MSSILHYVVVNYYKAPSMWYIHAFALAFSAYFLFDMVKDHRKDGHVKVEVGELKGKEGGNAEEKAKLVENMHANTTFELADL